jgi:arginase
MTIDDLAGAQPAIVEVQARISETTSRDLRGVGELSAAMAARYDVVPTVVEGRRGPFERTPWDDDLRASRPVLRQAGAILSEHAANGRRPLTLASDCALALGTLPAIGAHDPAARILWLDAHADYDAPDTTTIGFLGCMSLAGATGRWESGLGTIDPAAVVHAGARLVPGDFDEAGHREAEASEITMVPVSTDMTERVLGALGNAPVYVHLDPDVLDPAANPVAYGREDGMAADQLVGLLGAVAARGPVLGLEVTAYHSPDDPDGRAGVTQLLGEAVTALLT